MAPELIIYIVGTLLLVGLFGLLWIRKPDQGGLDPAFLEETKADRDDWRRQAEQAKGELSETRERLARLESAGEERDRLRDRLETLQQDRDALSRDLSGLREKHQAAERHHGEKLAELEKARESLSVTFKNLANDILKTSGEQLNKQGTETLSQMLRPLREQLDGFQKRVAEDAEKRSTQTGALHQLVSTLHNDARQMGEDAKNLANALRSQSKAQGDWGEFVLSSILERAGLREGQEFHTQDSVSDESGARQRPDVIVDMPNQQKLVIDAKVSLTAFERCVNADTDEERALALKQHLTSVRNHIKALGEKDYPKHYPGVSFTLMFVPLEGAASLALQNDPDLASFAWDRDVMIATPTTLMMAMRTVQNLWVIERQNQNAAQIAERAGKLYDKFEGFVKDLDTVGTRLNQAQDAWHGAKSKLVEGPGNVVRQTEMLKRLGAATKKSLPDEYIAASGADEDNDPAALEAPRGEED